MRNPWLRHPPGPEENRQAAGIALAVGGAIAAVLFYLARLILAREPIRPAGELSGEAGPPGWPRRGTGSQERERIGAGEVREDKGPDAGPADDPTVER